MAHQYKSALLNASQNEIVNEVIDALENNHLTTGVAGWTSDDDYILTFTSGGGYLHTFILLNNKHIVAIHFEDGILEYSFDKFDTIEDYLSEENQDKEKGFGWEFMQPNHDSRMADLSEGGFTSFFKNVVNKKFENGGNVYLDKNYNITYSVEQRPDGRWTVYAESPNFEKNDQYAPSGLASKEDAIDLAMLSAGVRKEEDPESYFMRREFKNGGTTSSEYEIVEGYDHYKNIPLYRVTNRDEYVGEWHTDLRVAENERSELNDTQIYVYSDIDSDTGIIAEIQNNKFDNLEAAKEYARSKGYPIEIVELHYGQYKYGGGIDVNTYDFNKLAGKYVNIYSMGVSAPSESQIKSAKISSPNFRYRDLTLQFDLGNAIIPFENINQFLNNQVVDVKADKEDYGIQLIENKFEKGGYVVQYDNDKKKTIIRSKKEVDSFLEVLRKNKHTNIEVFSEKDFKLLNNNTSAKKNKNRILITEDSGDGKLINDFYNLDLQAKTQKDFDNWVKVVKSSKFGKSGNQNIEKVISNLKFDMSKVDSKRLNYFLNDLKMTLNSSNKYEDGGVIGQEIVFDDSGEENTGVIKDIHEITGDYIVATDDGRTVLAQKEFDVISLGKIRKQPEAKKRFSFFEDGGNIQKENNEMLHSQAKEAKHHIEELHNILTTKTKVEPWVVAKMTRAKTDLSDITHYLDGNTSKMAKGGTLTSTQQKKFDKVMHEWKAGELHSGKNGPIVTNQDQAIAIAYSEARSKR